MTDLQAEKPSGAKEHPTPRRGLLTAGLALIFSLIATVGGAYLWYSLLYTHPELLTTDVAGRLDRHEEEARAQRENLDALQKEVTQLREHRDTVRTAIAKMQGELSRSRNEWLLSETEQLLISAHHRLQLARDIPSALGALRAADRQLVQLANPNLLPVRREITRVIALLESLEAADVTGITLRINVLAESLERMPLRRQLRTAPAAAPGDKPRPPASWGESAHTLWQDLLGLVRVRTDVGATLPLLPPEQQYFVRENLRLMLYGAQQSILQGNVNTYRQNLGTARRWLREHFDVDNAAVKNALTEIDRLLDVKLARDLPDISAPIDLLRRLSTRPAAP
jgi:uncharacterized protein HemX